LHGFLVGLLGCVAVEVVMVVVVMFMVVVVVVLMLVLLRRAQYVTTMDAWVLHNDLVLKSNKQSKWQNYSIIIVWMVVWAVFAGMCACVCGQWSDSCDVT